MIESYKCQVETLTLQYNSEKFELERINKLYDAELDRLRRLWAGAPPGSLGPAPAPRLL